jgi:hypothetical protein
MASRGAKIVDIDGGRGQKPFSICHLTFSICHLNPGLSAEMLVEASAIIAVVFEEIPGVPS